MYEIKVITLNHGNELRERVIISFHDSKYALLEQFFISDLALFQDEILSEINEIMSGKKAVVKLTGNRTAIEITELMITITDLYEEMYEDVESYPRVAIRTTLFRDIMNDWFCAINTFSNTGKI